MKKKICLFGLLAIFATVNSASATLISDVTPAVVGAEFTDGAGDYLGLVTAGPLIGGMSFGSSINPPVGSVAGEDLDGEGGSATRMVEWVLSLPSNAAPGTGLTSINFEGLLATSAGFDDADGSSPFELILNGNVVDTTVFSRVDDGDTFNTQLAVDTNGDGFGDGAIATATGTAVSFSDLGGSTITSASVKFTISANSGAEEFWTNGTLSADFTPAVVPEPSSMALLGLIGLAGLVRRRR